MYPLTPLPYAHDALEPVISKTTLETHHGKHHAKYVEVLNQLVGDEESRPLEDVVRSAEPGSKLFNNAGQAWNHGFFWQCMKPGGSKPSGELKDVIASSFGGLDQFREAFITEGATHFASGWAWLVREGGGLKVISTHDADTAITRPQCAPLLVCDVWEHAYYLDFKNDRKGFLDAWFDQLVNWDFVAERLAAAEAGEPGWRYPQA
ncbi:superoxide dismutase [Brevundimonas sp. 2R-24]|uniref:Superoxide dismutase n=1 Tax=Peiella sedimenti TaxID=3061083 RepID=A0ABT8SLP6_9CAUL|nr:superoxide dismutase [Caulobacteraceae bacterium XZ-24]